MNLASLSPVADHLWQSTLFAGAAGLLTLVLRQNRARVRHGLWLAASLKFLVPLSVLIALGSHIPRPAAPPNLPVVIYQVSEPFTVPVTPLVFAEAKPAVNPFPAIFWSIWLCGFAGISISWWFRWRRIRAAVRAGSPVNLAIRIRAFSSPTLVEPGVFGIFRPALMLPEGIFERLTPEQLRSVVTHELCHVRYRDNLVAALHMFVETVFWFHPMVWWIGKRMVEERERACDEAVLRMGNRPREYAEAILNVCKLYTESPLACVSGITGANLKRRIEVIMTKRIARDLSVAKKFGLALAGAAALIAPIAIGMMHSTPLSAQPVAAPAPPAAATPAALPTVEKAHNVPLRLFPKSTAMAPAAIAQQPAAPTADAERQKREAYAKANFTNLSMQRTYIQYGPADHIEDRSWDTANPRQIWQYNYLDDFHTHAEFEFSDKNRHSMAITWPPPLATFEGKAQVDSTARVLANALNQEGRAQQLPAVADPQAGLPVRHASIQVYTSKQPVTLTLPIDSMSGRIDVIATIAQTLDGGAKGPTVVNLRDFFDHLSAADPAAYNANFTLQPGSYVCRVLVRETTTGQIYAESIPFQVQ